ncbi:hypothetical protein AXG93_3661s1540 [Marchantia polymorpha subsp. ruderalis]|uniref:TATA box-binding protein-associated factor RNA polymerase I subunit B n=2 Tax=Marchantia polymorpha TaxID=3197 RepID=A0A176VJJ2_MARPO|nr:hypothetical protein AXG93_3661s1540 [Marchantia polymorpha subsp. ruderalis]
MTTGVDGSYFCQSCGAQNENYIEEAFDNDDAHVFTARFVRETRVGASQNEEQVKSQIPPEIFAGSQAFISQPPPGLASQSPLGDVYGSVYGIGSGAGSGAGPSQASQLLSSQFGLASQKSQRQQPIDKETLSNSIRKSYVEGIQKILFLQCEALVKEFDVTPLICGIVGPIWLRYLASTRVFEEAWADEALEVAEDRESKRKGSRRRVFKENEADPEPEVPEESMVLERGVLRPKKPRKRRQRRRKGGIEPRTTFGRKARFVWLSALKERIPLSITLAFCYLACYIARESVFPTDIRLWALKGKLPFLAAYLEVSKPSANHIPNTVGGLQTFPIEPKTMFKPGNVVGARAVELLAGHIAERIGLQLSPVNYHALSARLLHAMKLPVEKLSVYTHRIYEWYCPAGLWLTSKESALPTRVYVMAMIIIVLKVLYKLDGRIENPISDSEAAPNAMNGETFFNNRDSQGAGNDSPDDKEVDSDGGYYSEADVTSQRKKKNGMDEKDINSVADLASGKANELEEVWDVKKLIMCMKKMKPFRNKINEMGDPERKLASYLNYCREVIYPGPASDADEEAMRDHFWKVYEKANEATANKQPGEAENNLRSAMNAGEDLEGNLGDNVDVEGRNDNLRYPARTYGSVGSVAGARNKYQSRMTLNDGHFRDDGVGPKPSGEAKEGQYDAIDRDKVQGSDSEMVDQYASEDNGSFVRKRELQTLMKEMKKLGFSCLQPMRKDRLPENVYLRYKIQVSDKDLRPVHEEYYIVLRVCAKLIKVHPKALHWGVQKVEQGLMEIERNTRQFMLDQGGHVAKLYKQNFGERTEYRERDRGGEYAKKKQKLILAQYRVDQGLASEKDYTELILHADYL